MLGVLGREFGGQDGVAVFAAAEVVVFGLRWRWRLSCSWVLVVKGMRERVVRHGEGVGGHESLGCRVRRCSAGEVGDQRQ